MGNRRAFWAALTLVIAMCVSCTEILGIHDGYLADAGMPCTDPSPCDDTNACTTDGCVDGQCESRAVPDGDAAGQVPGDCHKIVCAGGREEVVIDATDIQDDGAACTTDTCDASGSPSHTAVPAGTPCKVAGQDGECDAARSCVHTLQTRSRT